ncbi:prepilin-type N-terminal cleavage/methylation domain-containing protein [Anaeromyxobacter sp. SG17]|uniref:type IV pilus modification PilV family protein n=1 Tax=Anaeromyxobacter sp. SG17 TaxID=2925405 RepID=UPI001F5A6BC9|nr:prepilin-type N-terminal cleavage/methylation domain-containing protein [Anaeromyxobacter sp. SG17]
MPAPERHRLRPFDRRGFTLLEVMIALAILSVGLLGMMQLQIMGITSNSGARAQTIASQLATELAGALEALPFDDAQGRLSGPAATATPPAGFGRRLGAGTTGTLVHTWSDAMAVPGARLDSSLEADPLEAGKPLYRRAWTVWNYSAEGTASGASASKVIAVSVIYHERWNGSPREVVVLSQRSNAGLALSYAAAYR